MEKKMETTIMGYVGVIGIMEKRMETNVMLTTGVSLNAKSSVPDVDF